LQIILLINWDFDEEQADLVKNWAWLGAMSLIRCQPPMRFCFPVILSPVSVTKWGSEILMRWNNVQTLYSCCILAIVCIYLLRKGVCLFCLSWGDLLNHGAPPNILGTSGQPSIGRGALWWFCSVGGIEYQTIDLENSIKLKLNFLGELGCTLRIVGKCSMGRIYEGDFLIFRRMVK
jgi:hypothetical protein